jgi:hypothetical protein
LSELRAVNPASATRFDLLLRAVHARDVAGQPDRVAQVLAAFAALLTERKRPAKMHRLKRPGT